MKKSLLVWQIVGLTFTAVVGTLLHFLYHWTSIKLVAIISAVNESTWEHMKLVFVPSLIFAVIQSHFLKADYKCFWMAKFIGIVVGTLLIPILFYTLGGAFGELSAITNILIFFIAVIIEYLVELILLNKINCVLLLNYLAIGILLIILLLFFIFTFYPPKIPLFLDPLTNRYGIVKLIVFSIIF